jgi:N-methylhydantoinase B
VFRHIHAGGGGWGDPLERDPEAVLKDVRNQFVSAARAEADYGVVIDTANWRIDQEATARKREELSRERGWSEPPKVNRGRLPATPENEAAE